MTSPATLFVRILVVGTTLAAATGIVWGFVRGLAWLPTLPVAMIEGGVVVGVPGCVVSAVTAAVVAGIASLRRRRT